MLRAINAAVQLKLQAASRTTRRAFRDAGGPSYVFDHASSHEAAVKLLREEGWLQRMEHPANSPDFNRVAEHALGTIKETFRDSVLRDEARGAARLTMDQARARVRQCAEENLSLIHI